MRKLTVVTLLTVAAACSRTYPEGSFSSASGSLAVSRDGNLVYVAESDTNALVVLDAKSLAVVGRVQVGDWPERVTVAPDDRIYVTNRFSRSVSVIEKGSWDAPVNEIAVGAEPIGVAVSPDGKKLAVANSTSGTVSVVDLATMEQRELPAKIHVSGVRFAGEKLYATVYRGGEVLRIDDLDAKVVSLNQEIELVPPSCQFCGSVLERRDANLVPDAVVSPEGRLYLAHVQVKADPASTDVPGAYYGSDFSSGVSVPVVAEAVTTFDTETDTVVPQPNIASPVNQQGEVVPPALFVAEGQPMATPAAAALDPTGSWLFIANQNTDNVVVVSVRGRRSPTSVQGIFAQVKVGAGPKGIALSPDGRTAYVHNALDYTVSVLRASADGATLVVDRTAKFVESSPVPADVERGRRLFYSASNSRISNPNFGIACASCHPGGRDDGRTWDLPFQGLRNTPTLAGRHLRETKPYHWDGEFDEFSAFNKVIRERMGGTGALSRDFEDILTFLDSRWNPAPDNPHRTVDGGLTAAQARGRIVYEGKAGCGSCHSGAALTDNKSYSATRFTSRTGDTLMGGNVNTPSLRGLFATAPFLHDGTVGTLEARVAADRSGQHGTTSALTDGERADLVAYLKTL